jgi:hypothetical protein
MTGTARLLESLDRHFLAGCPSLSARQLAQHRARGSCTDCTEGAAAALEEAERRNAVYERYAYGGPGVRL